jgi:hypothetical protein
MGKMLDRDTTRQLYFLCTQGLQSLLLSCKKTNDQGNVNSSVAVFGLVSEAALLMEQSSGVLRHHQHVLVDNEKTAN